MSDALLNFRREADRVLEEYRRRVKVRKLIAVLLAILIWAGVAVEILIWS